MATDAGHGFIIGGHLTPANPADSREIMKVNTESKVLKCSRILVDQGNAGNDGRMDPEERQLTDGIM